MTILIGIVTFILLIISAFLVLIVLAQKAKSDGGVGAAMGGGAAEATFGAETGNVLTKATIYAAIAFFVLSFGLYLAHIHQHKHGKSTGAALPTIAAPAIPAASAAAVPAATVPEATTAAPSSAPAAVTPPPAAAPTAAPEAKTP